MKVGDACSCVFCLQPNHMIVCMDKKGRPYLSCYGCGTRCFLRGLWALKGPERLWGKLVTVLQTPTTAGAEAGRKLLNAEVERESANAVA